MFTRGTFIDHLTGIEYQFSINGGEIKIGLASEKPYQMHKINGAFHCSALEAIYKLEDALLEYEQSYAKMT